LLLSVAVVVSLLLGVSLVFTVPPLTDADEPGRHDMPAVTVQAERGEAVDGEARSNVLRGSSNERERDLLPSQMSGKLYGVNLSAGEYTPSSLPGVQGRDYVYPYSGVTTSLYPGGYQGAAYFAGKGLRLLRVPVRWERLQPVAFGPLSAGDVAGVRRVLDDAASRGQQVILELHNFGGYYGTKLTVSQAGQFADAWEKIAGAFAGHPGLYGYELMNEPGDLPGGSATWKVLAQAGVDGVRRSDRGAWVLVPGYHWQKAHTWREYNEELLVVDPVGKVLYAAHSYFDWDATGFHRYSYDAGGAYPEIGVDRLRPFVEWLRAHGVRGIITEYGVVESDVRWLTVLDNFLRVVDSEERLVGAVAWAAGPLWGTPRDLGLDPLNGRDQPQMQVIVRYSGGSIPPGVRRSGKPPREEPVAITATGLVLDRMCQALGQPHDRCVLRRLVLTGWSWISDRLLWSTAPPAHAEPN
jgi:endoglucanase